MAVDEPEIVVGAIRTVLETARGHDVPLFAPRLPQTLTVAHLGNESALGPTGVPSAGLRGLSQCLDPAQQGRDLVPTGER